MADPIAGAVYFVSLLLMPGLILVVLAVALAAFGKSIGVREVYVQLILKVFEWGRQKISNIEEQKAKYAADDRAESSETDEEADEEIETYRASSDEQDRSHGELPVVPPLPGDDSGSTGSANAKDGGRFRSMSAMPAGRDSENDEPPSESAALLAKRKVTVSESKAYLLKRRKSTHSESKADQTIQNKRTLAAMEAEFKLTDVMYFCKKGIEAITDDEVTQRFSSSELPSWNLLTRTNKNYQFLSLRLTILWCLGFILRYCILLPWRIAIAVVGILLLIATSAIVGYVPNMSLKMMLNRYFTVMCCRIIVRAFGAVIRFHNSERKAKADGICVANHTSPIDVVILQCDNAYAMIGQKHSGFLGVMQRSLSRATDHIWFERSEAKDRHAVATRLKEHVADENKLPILIFPEGTCINNTSVMMFKKGSFEVGGVIYPVAIKYDPRFADAFWNSSRQSMVKHILMIMSSWALVCDVWYLPPETQRPDENAIEFANRVKAIIANQGGLVDLEWDGGLKREKPSEALKRKQQAEYSSRMLLKSR